MRAGIATRRKRVVVRPEIVVLDALDLEGIAREVVVRDRKKEKGRKRLLLGLVVAKDTTEYFRVWHLTIDAPNAQVRPNMPVISLDGAVGTVSRSTVPIAAAVMPTAKLMVEISAMDLAELSVVACLPLQWLSGHSSSPFFCNS